MEEGSSLVRRKAAEGILNSNDLPRHFISMREIQISMQEIRNKA